MTKGGVDDDGDEVAGVLAHVGEHRLVELTEARHRATLRGHVGTIDHDVSGHTVDSQPPEPGFDGDPITAIAGRFGGLPDRCAYDPPP